MSALLWVGLILLVAGFLYIVYCSAVASGLQFEFRPSVKPAKRSQPAQEYVPIALPDFSTLQSEIKELAKIGWATAESLQNPNFSLSPEQLSNAGSLEATVQRLLRHAQVVAPGFEIPSMVPRVLVEPMLMLGGQFVVDEEGWVTLKVNSSFFNDPLAAQAILAHEVCHYILENSGLRKSDRELNERYTDLCMFVCGFGPVFLAGYKREVATKDYRLGHRLGYLSDAEYTFVENYVTKLRRSDTLGLPGELDRLKQQLRQLVYDAETCQRIIETARRKYPAKSEIDLYRDEIANLLRDRR